MDSRELAALLSSLLSQLLLLLSLLFPPSSNFPNFNTPLLTHFLFSQQIAASLPFLSLSRKRKRPHSSESDSPPNGDAGPQTRPHFCRNRSPDSFRNHFRMTSSTFEWLSGLLEPLLECRDPVGSPINLSAEVRLGVGLSRLATGCEFSTISGQFGVSESVARFCAKHLCRVLCTNFRFWVEFPGPHELVSTASSFENLSGLPNCCGVISCARFKIVESDHCSEDSIAAQLVVDSSSRILSIIAGFRGDKNDSVVLSSSTLFKDIGEGRVLNSPPVLLNGVAVNQYLIGNGEYPLLPWLMVPFAGAVSGSIEDSFNEAHRLTCVPAQRAIVSLRSWGVLSQPLREEFKTAVAYIGACSILHNALLMREDFSAMADECESLSLHDYGFRYRETGSHSSEEKACVMQRALAERTRELQS